MAFEKRTTLRGSERKPPSGSQQIGAIQPSETVRVTVILRRKGADPAVAMGSGPQAHLSHDEFAQQHGANPDDIALVEKFAHEYQLTVVESSPQKRRVVLTGTAAAMTKAFGVAFACYKVQSTGHTFRGRTGAISIPQELEGVVVAVLGLDTRPVAKPHFRRRKKAAAPTSFTPPQVAALYDYPAGVTGEGQTIAIIELGGGYSTADLKTYFSGLGVNEPTVTAVSVDGGQNSPGTDADDEVMLDIEVVGAIATGASIAVYFAPNTDQGFVDAITDAVHDTTRKPSVLSISWGGPEDSWTAQSQTAMNSALQDAASLGVTVTVASGDNGSSDGAGDGKLHVDFPASSPYALACGGTTLIGSGKTISSEVVWNETANQEGATGGGVSNVFALPTYQSSAGVPKQPETGFVGRGVPDVSGDADPSTGYQVLVDGQSQVVGGTSAVAPLWAALTALLNEQLGANVGFLNPKLYPLGESAFHDITSGNNDDSSLGSYSAKTGWDACTGLGSPNGSVLLQALSGSGSSAQRARVPGSTPKHSPSDQLQPHSRSESRVSNRKSGVAPQRFRAECESRERAAFRQIAIGFARAPGHFDRSRSKRYGCCFFLRAPLWIDDFGGECRNPHGARARKRGTDGRSLWNTALLVYRKSGQAVFDLQRTALAFRVARWNCDRRLGPGPAARSQASHRLALSQASSVQRPLTGRARFPAPVDPHPLLGILPDNTFDSRVDALRVPFDVARYFNARIEPQRVLFGTFVPKCESRHHRSAGMVRKFNESRSGAGQLTKKIDEHALRCAGILIDQHADRLIVLQCLNNRARRIAFEDQAISGKRAPLFDNRINQRIIERARHHVHRFGHQGVCERAEFPIAQMRGRD